MEEPALPPDLGQKALGMFDSLMDQGRLKYEPTQGEIVETDGFKIEFRIGPVLRQKPMLSEHAPERRGNGGPFMNPDPDFVVAAVGDNHILVLNMYTLCRPAFVLHTRLFEKQTDDLDLSDLIVARAVMATLGRDTPQLAIYNCGVESGSSQGHKHMQIFDLPTPFKLFPEAAPPGPGITSDIPGVPIKHFVSRLPTKALPHKIQDIYHQLLLRMRTEQALFTDSRGYNLAMTDNWLALSPRRHARKEIVSVNSIGVLGVVWLSSREERALWDEVGPTQLLQHVGIPI